jgi:hypothetical protein
MILFSSRFWSCLLLQPVRWEGALVRRAITLFKGNAIPVKFVRSGVSAALTDLAASVCFNTEGAPTFGGGSFVCDPATGQYKYVRGAGGGARAARAAVSVCPAAADRAGPAAPRS